MKSHLLLLLFIVFAMMPSLRAQPDSTRTPDTTALDGRALEAELARELGAVNDSSASPVLPAAQVSSPRTLTSLNPRISAIGTFFGSGAEEGAVVKTRDLGLRETEISLNAYVDPYARADFFIAFGRELEDPFVGPDSGIAGSGEFAAELEEAYLTTLSLPGGLQLKAGKFRSNFGKINPLHPHALNYIDMPRMYVNYLGEEGLNDQGISVNWLVPNPWDLYQELTLEVTSGAVEAPAFGGGSNHLLYLARLKNFFDLNENTTLEVGFSGLLGPNDAAGHKSRIVATDLTIKWKPLRRNRYRSFEWTTEALLSERDLGAAKVTSRALYSFLRYQIGKRWFIGARYDYSQFPDNGDIHEQAYSGIVNFFATEFQKIELQFQHGKPAEQSGFNRLLLRLVFVIGAHGAHKY